MSASATSSSSSSQDEGEVMKNGAEIDPELINQKSLQTNGYTNAIYANSTISTLDRSHYQPISGIRRVTVQFSKLKVVVPWKESPHSTVRQLADAALMRYKRAIGIQKNDDRVRLIRLECASDGGILDMDDILEDVFDLNYDQILAITDEANSNFVPNHHYAQPVPVSRPDIPGPSGVSSPIASAYGSVTVNAVHHHQSASPYNVGYIRKSTSSEDGRQKRPDSIVEVRDLKHEVSPGLKVLSTPSCSSAETRSSLRKQNGPRSGDQTGQLRSSLRSESVPRSEPSQNEAVTSPKQARVTLSPEVEKKLEERDNERASQRKNLYEKNPGRLQRGADRKSRINDAFMDARDRLVEKFENELAIDVEKKKRSSKSAILPGTNPGTTIISFNAATEDDPKSMGIEVNAVYDDETTSTSEVNRSSKISAIQIMKIETDGRIGKDGRLKVGDNIVEIDGRPVYQMSILRARAYITDLAVSPKDVTLTVARPIESFLEEEETDQKPIQSALQQANTQYIGHTTIVELIKGTNGFGFTVTGRETAKGERLFYIGTVKPNGVALGHLKTGDRLLEINGESTGNLTQAQIVEKLKETMVGGKVKFLVSRVAQVTAKQEKDKQETTQSTPPTLAEEKENENKNESGKGTAKKEDQKMENEPRPDLLSPNLPKDSQSTPSPMEIIIPLNDTGSAGLGVSLKARVSVKSDTTRHDCGIFIKNVMHGGAAFKDGRLQVNDRIVGIEDIELQSMSNSAASEALTKKLKSIGPNSSHVKLSIIRENDRLRAGPISRDSSRITVDAPSPAPSSRMSSNTTPGSLLHSPHARTLSSSGADSQHSRQSSTSATTSQMPTRKEPMERNRDSIISDLHRIDDSELQDSVDPFDREAPGRKSLSEKRGLGAASDPQHIKLFQEIKHQRQNSAPPSSTSRSEKRSKSQPRSLSQRNYRSPSKSGDAPEPPSASTMPRHQPLQTSASEGSGLLNRRSLSMESINRPAGILTNPSTSKVQFSSPAGEHPFPPGSPLMRLKSEESRARDKSRRKSVGNAMKNFFGFGSKSRDTSPEKGQSFTKISSPPRDGERNEENGGGRRRGSGSGAVFVDYGEPYGVIPQYPPHQAGRYEPYADAGLYDRYAAHRYQQQRANYVDDEYLYRFPNSSTCPPTYVNYGLPTSHSYHVDARLPTATTPGGTATAASLRRAYDYDDSGDSGGYQHIPTGRGGHRAGSGRGDYYHMFNSWFAYTGGGAVGAAPVIKSAYGSPVRIAAASAIERGESFAGGGADRCNSGHGTFSRAQEKYADARNTKGFNGGSTRMFIPRHGGGISAAAFAGGFEERGGSSSPRQIRRRDHLPTNRFSEY